ncbi:MAG: histidine phosphatase family protein [Alphaproteobacteria bacterium]|nr:histidine phosphatase family protein [Alphaproteobacteria bacterium]
MTLLALLRHGATEWNAAGRLQGRADPPLLAAARLALAERCLPRCLAGACWHVSPLRRAAETAGLLGGAPLRLEPRLVELDFGAFEGRRLVDLRRDPDAAMAANEARGLDFQPPGGESPRQLRDGRLRPWLAELSAAGGWHVAVTHKTPIRVMLTLACDWPLLGKPPVRLDWDCLQLFWLEAGGAPRPLRFNLPLAERAT